MKTTLLLAAAAGALALPSVAAAHVTVQPSSLPQGAFARMDVRVPNERDRASTTRVQITLPAGVYFLSYEPKPGWRVRMTRQRLAQPVQQFGITLREQFRTVTWTATRRSARIPPHAFLDFGLSGNVPGRAGQRLSFPAIQTYSNGERVRWTGPPTGDTPAPRVRIVAPEPEDEG